MADGVAGKKDFLITCEEDCGNAPKKELLKKLHIALAGMDAQFMNENFTDGIQMNYVGERIIQGKDQVIESLCQVKYGKTAELHIHHLITHGSTGAAEGILVFDDRKRLAFCNVYRFSSSAKIAKIKKITSYIIPLSE
ncbi:hypothetical protein J14TS5_21680 [Paenibacillus lautus]|uniref:hypothetical protein n=1 Tax=Paenibacillus lautus TaxID=1401 RepID=UPI001B0B6DD0|nr:hypothetical protein [Paenibacillus lautus]GIO97082.1 hypothetical protein J14TS5_21680 [Paenibacillus lautus]